MCQKKITICFDVDGTLINVDIPRYDIIQLFHIFKKMGHNVYIWSGGGIEYASHWRDKLGLEAIVIVKGSIIPDIAIDDQDVCLGKVNLQV